MVPEILSKYHWKSSLYFLIFIMFDQYFYVRSEGQTERNRDERERERVTDRQTDRQTES